MSSPQPTKQGNDEKLRILNVDDDPVTRRIIRVALERAGFQVWSAASGSEAMDFMQRWGLPHLALVDVQMPVMTGPQFCGKIQEYLDLPVVMVSSIDDKKMMVQVLQKFAEDYIVKPFEPDVLVARVRCLLKRLGKFPCPLSQRIRIDEHLQLELAQRLAIIDNREIELTPTETKLLHILIRNAGHTTFTDFLLRRMWPMGEIFEDTLRTHVYRLRRKIEATPDDPQYLLTKRGLGYSFSMTAPMRPAMSPC